MKGFELINGRWTFDSGNLPVYIDVGTADLTAPFQQKDYAASGYSYNLVDLQVTTGNSLRGWRVNLSANPSATVTDLQCVHGYLTLPASATVASGGAIYPLSSWIDIPAGVTWTGSNVVAGLRVIFDANTNDLRSGGVESALIYAQTWASAGQIDSGLFIAAGAGSTIDSMIELGGSGTVGTIIDLTSWGADTTLVLVQGGPKDATATAHWKFGVGDATDHAGIVAALGGTSYGSIYASTGGKLWVNESGTWTAQT